MGDGGGGECCGLGLLGGGGLGLLGGGGLGLLGGRGGGEVGYGESQKFLPALPSS